jgi:sugar-specific transcriptional regulator TrmB
MEYKTSDEFSRQALVQSGLSASQSALYEVLIQNGPLTATRAAFLASVPRTLSYKVLDELQELGLISKKDEPGVALFSPAHPLKLKELAEKRLTEAKDAKVALDSALSKLISDFNTVAGQPGVRILEGVRGVAELYEDQLNEGQPIKLIRSPKDDDVPELQALVRRQIEEQKKLGISVRVIAPMTPGTPKKVIERDADRGVERRIVPRDEFSIPAQVVIYANKVALTSYDGQIITTIIENTAIRQTFEILFEYMWKMAEPGHKKILETIQN